MKTFAYIALLFGLAAAQTDLVNCPSCVAGGFSWCVDNEYDDSMALEANTCLETCLTGFDAWSDLSSCSMSTETLSIGAAVLVDTTTTADVEQTEDVAVAAWGVSMNMLANGAVVRSSQVDWCLTFESPIVGYGYSIPVEVPETSDVEDVEDVEEEDVEDVEEEVVEDDTTEEETGDETVADPLILADAFF